MSLLIVVLTSGVSIMRSDVSPGGANSVLLAFHYEHFPHNEAHTLTGVLQDRMWGLSCKAAFLVEGQVEQVGSAYLGG